MKEIRELIHSANLTKTQKMIAKFILDNSADACFMTSTPCSAAPATPSAALPPISSTCS